MNTSEYNRQYYTLNKARIIAGKDRLKGNAASRKYKAANRDKVNKQRAQHQRERRELDIVFKLRCDISNSINKVLTGTKQGRSCLDYLPFTIEEFIAHFEIEFRRPGNEWMNWGNRGKYARSWDDSDISTWCWQIDHIVPCSDLPHDSMEHANFGKCWALENLRPLSAKQNVLDGVNRVRHVK